MMIMTKIWSDSRVLYFHSSWLRLSTCEDTYAEREQTAAHGYLSRQIRAVRRRGSQKDISVFF